MITKTFIFGCLVIGVSFLYSRFTEKKHNDPDQQEQAIIDAWNLHILTPKKQFRRIAVGINCNLDLIVSGVELMNALGQTPGDSLDSVVLDSIQDMTETFTHYFSKGAAAERIFTNKQVYKTVTDTAETLNSKEHYTGGNAALMAVKVAELFDDAVVQLVGPIGPELQKLLPGKVLVPQESLITKDEVHLIMEYGLADVWGDLRTPVATRFITSHDEANSQLAMLQTFFASLEPFSPDLILFSGLHLLEANSRDTIVSKLDEVREGFRSIDPRIPLHLELASMASGDVVKLILDQVVADVTSLGLNEQELSFCSHVAGGPHGDDFLTQTGQPDIHKTGDMVLWLLKTYGHSKDNPNSKLTRVHFHSLTYHIVGTVPGIWSNSESAVAAGTRTAGRQACDMHKLSPLGVELRIPQTFRLFTGDMDRHFSEKNPVLSWDLEGFHFVFSPVLVCKDPQKTVGLGDAISATGLMFSHYSPEGNS